MLSIHKINPMARAIGTMGVIAAVVSGVTLAAQQTNTVALTGSSLSVTNDVLRISNGGAFGASATGFSDTNLTLGNQGPKHEFFLQNLDNANLEIFANIPIGSVGSSSGLDLTKVHVNFFDENQAALNSATFADLETGNLDIGQLLANAQGSGAGPTEGNYYYSVSTDAGAATGNPSQVGTFDLNFFGTTP